MRTGTLNEVQERHVEDVLAYASWGQIAGSWPSEYPPPLDGGSGLLLEDTTYSVSCYSPCDHPDNPPAVVGLPERYMQLLATLWHLGEPVQGPVRVKGVRIAYPIPEFFTIFEWPLPSPPAPYLVDASEATTAPSRLVDDPVAAATLRALWLDAVAQDDSHGSGFIYVRDPTDGTLFTFAVRDAYPFETPDGALGFPRRDPATPTNSY